MLLVLNGNQCGSLWNKVNVAALQLGQKGQITRVTDVHSQPFDSPVIVLECCPSTSVSHCPLYIVSTMFLSLQK